MPNFLCPSVMWLCLFCGAVTKQVTAHLEKKLYASSIYILTICLFRDCLMTLDTAHYGVQQMNWEGSRRKQSQSSLRHRASLCLERIEERTDSSVRICGLRANISKWNLLNTSTSLLCSVQQTKQLSTTLQCIAHNFSLHCFQCPLLQPMINLCLIWDQP
jgi:hypothetical protein